MFYSYFICHYSFVAFVRSFVRWCGRSFVPLNSMEITKRCFVPVTSETFFQLFCSRYQWNVFHCRSLSLKPLNMLRNKPPPKWLWIGNSNTRPFVTSFDNEFRKFSLCTKIDQYKTVSRKMRGYFSASQNQIRRGDIFLDVEICQS